MSNDEDVGHPILRIRAADIPNHRGRVTTENETSQFPPKFILLFDAKTGRPLTAFNEFLRDTAVAGRTDFAKWKNTQEAYADDGANFATFLHFRNKTFETATFQDIKDYSALLQQSISSQTGRKFETQTRSRRLTTIVAFYEHAHEKGSLPRIIPPRTGGLPVGLKYKVEKPRADRSVRALVPTKVKTGEKINLIPILVLKKALAHLGPKIHERRSEGPSIRDRLLAESGLATGGRLVSLMSVKVVDVLNAEQRMNGADPSELLIMPVETKGGAEPSLLVPQWLLKKWLVYYRGERAEICRRMIERFGRSRAISDNLFLNGINSNDRDLGNAANEDTISRAFSKALIAIGHTRLEKRAVRDGDGVPIHDPKGGFVWEWVKVPANTFHDLRHTFVVTTYHAMKRAGDTSPWKVISLALGHRNISTTIDIYGKHVAIDESSLSDAMNQFLYSLDD
jgi:integrase